MPVTVVKPSAAVARVLSARCGELAAGAAPRLAIPHPVFNLGVDDIVQGGARALDRAAMTGWRYLLFDGTQPVAAVEAAASWRDDAPRWSHTHRSDAVASMARRLREACDAPHWRSRDAVIALLRVPALGVSALWLRDAQGRGEHDVFIALDPVPAGLATQPMNARPWLAALSVLARKRPAAAGDSN